MSNTLALVTGRKSQNLLSALRKELSAAGFRFGQQFYTISEIAAKFRVSPATAIKCIDQLEREGLVVRRHGSGTYVQRLPGVSNDFQQQVTATASAAVAPRSVDFILPDNLESRAGSELLDCLYSIVHGELRVEELAVRVSLLPGRIQSRDEMQSWMENRMKSGTQALVFQWAPRLAQEIAVERGWPACVRGRPDDGIDLPYIDSDQKQVGKIIAEYLLSRDCQRVGLLVRSEWRAGDNMMFNSLIKHLGPRLVALETSHQNDVEVDSAIRRLIAQEPAIDGLIVRSHVGPWLARHTDELVDGGMKIVHAGPGKRWSPRVASVSPDNAGAVGALVDCIKLLISGRRPEPAGIELGVSIVMPDEPRGDRGDGA